MEIVHIIKGITVAGCYLEEVSDQNCTKFIQKCEFTEELDIEINTALELV